METICCSTTAISGSRTLLLLTERLDQCVHFARFGGSGFREFCALLFAQPDLQILDLTRPRIGSAHHHDDAFVCAIEKRLERLTPPEEDALAIWFLRRLPA